MAAQSAWPAGRGVHGIVRLPCGVPVASSTGTATLTRAPPAPVRMPCTSTPPPVLVNWRQFKVVGVGHDPTAMVPLADGPAGGEVSTWQVAPLGMQAAAGSGVIVGVDAGARVAVALGGGMAVALGGGVGVTVALGGG